MIGWQTVSIPKNLLEKVEKLVEDGYYICVSEFVAEAIQNLLENIWKRRLCLLYTRKHVWIENYSEKAKVGLSEYAVNRLKTIIDIKVSNVNRLVKRNEPLALLETTSNKLFIVYSPVSGRLRNVNMKVLEQPYLINEDPYGEGWIVTIEPSDFDKEKAYLLTYVDYEEWLNSLSGRLFQRR